MLETFCNYLKSGTMEILTLGWVSLLVVFTWSIAMVVWGRNGL
ncbi:petN, cytochrome b6-f complex subunit 8 [Nostoc sphaeroides CCNUC1]|nr:petN, cytochrome b6-f complex subunit 8 [Nostoc sphaeroides CCNUC1]